jgi:hypothetical protein
MGATHTPVRRALRADSGLLASVADGLGALKKGHRACLEDAVRQAFADSLDLDRAMAGGHEQENRWDYLLGHGPSHAVIAVEPHSARQDEVATVIRKRAAARDQLKEHLRDGARVTRWLWVASGKVRFADTERTRRLLDQNGIQFVGSRVLAKHLPGPSVPAPSARASRRGRSAGA